MKHQKYYHFIVIQWDFIVIQWDCIVIQWDVNGICPLVNIQKAIEHGHRNSEFSDEKLGDFP